MVDVVAAAAWWSAAVWPALCRASDGPCGCCRAHARNRAWLGSVRAVILWSGPRRRAMLAACNPSIVQWVVCVTTCMVQDACRLCACVRAEIRTYICGSGSGVAAMAIAVDREASDASRVPQTAYRIGTYTCMPYEYNWSQDVEKCTLDLVLSYSTRTNAVQTVAIDSKGWWFFPLHPLSGCECAMWVELSTGMGRVSLEGMFVMPYGPCGVPITLIHSHSDFPTRSYRYDLASVARHQDTRGIHKGVLGCLPIREDTR